MISKKIRNGVDQGYMRKKTSSPDVKATIKVVKHTVPNNGKQKKLKKKRKRKTFCKNKPPKWTIDDAYASKVIFFFARKRQKIKRKK